MSGGDTRQEYGIHFIDQKGFLSIFYKVLWVPHYVLVKPDGSIADADAPQAINQALKIEIEGWLKKLSLRN